MNSEEWRSYWLFMITVVLFGCLMTLGRIAEALWKLVKLSGGE